jgi:hypothetical protein
MKPFHLRHRRTVEHQESALCAANLPPRWQGGLAGIKSGDVGGSCRQPSLVLDAPLENIMSQGATDKSKSFRPYIHVEGETTVPSSIGLFGVAGGQLNLIDVPQPILDLVAEEQLAALTELMRFYLDRYEGLCPFFGRVVGFRFVRPSDYCRFDKDGNFMERVDKTIRRGQAIVFLG